MDVLIVSERVYPHIGGTETRWDEIGKRLSDNSINVSFITGRGDITSTKPMSHNYSKYEKYNGYKIYRVADFYPGKLISGTRSFRNIVNFGIQTAKYVRKITKNNITV